MQYALGLLALAASAVALPQGVTQAISPSSPSPAGCSSSYSGSFEVTVVNVTTSKAKRDALVCTLSGGVLKDAQGRTGYIASNYQFQFDGPPQAGAIYTSGFSVCSNGTLALGGSAIWYQCLSGGFYNLYDRSWAAQCSPIYIEVIGGGSAGAATQAADGQPGVTTKVTQISDGQVQATTVAVTQIADGQVQASRATGAPVTQISDGQVQAATKTAVQQISDGQVQATRATAVPVTQISDGQIQAATKTAVQQISDGQVQAPKSTTPVQQISDGQVQAPKTTATNAPVQQISDGQVQATRASSVSVTAVQAGVSTTSGAAKFTGAAMPRAAQVPAAAVAGIAAAIAFL